MVLSDAISRTWAIFFARLILGLIFFMAWAWKAFQLSFLPHARRLFVEPRSGVHLGVSLPALYAFSELS